MKSTVIVILTWTLICSLVTNFHQSTVTSRQQLLLSTMNAQTRELNECNTIIRDLKKQQSHDKETITLLQDYIAKHSPDGTCVAFPKSK